MIRINPKTGKTVTLLCSLIFGGLFSAHAQGLQPTYSTTVDVNSVLSYNPMAPISDMPTVISSPLQDVKRSVQYVDGLGRPIQTVIKQGSLVTATGSNKDLVNTVLYDGFGREQYKYLPFAANGNNTNDGTFKLNAFKQQADFSTGQYPGETFFYSKTNFDGSAMNQVTDTYAPGNSWAGSEAGPAAQQRNVQVKNTYNTQADDVKIWTVVNSSTAGAFGSYQLPATGDNYYAAGELYKTIITDEHKKQSIEFKDKEGKVVLKKVQLTATADDGSGTGYPGWLSTVYIYDVLGNLRCVVQPKGVEQLAGSSWNLSNTTLLNELCFRYEYDSRNRMIKKQVPGAAAESMVYDARDRIVLTQGGNLATQGKWLYTQYDALNRPIATGLWASSLTQGQHAALAASSTSYPSMTGEEELTHTYYDDYDSWLAASGNPFENTRSTATDMYLNAATTTYPYTLAVTQSNATKGMVTGNKVKVLGTTDTYLYGIIYYDDKGRVIQTQSTNIADGTDINTTQYNWAGQPLLTIVRHEIRNSNPQISILVTNITYDVLGRVTKTEKKISNSLVSDGAMSAYTTTAQMEYDALGQLKKKKLGTKSGTTDALETLNYDYNIRGWLLGVNRDYAKDAAPPSGAGGAYFGFDLGYDKADNHIIGSQTYAHPQYNGNIEGMVWKSKGDGEKRKYDFTYDPLNRLLAADFNQYTGTSFSKTAGVDFSVKMGDGINATSAYDANGNIKAMTQYGLKINSSNPIDQLTYAYTAGTNKLAQVTDAVNDMNSLLGDFKYDPSTKNTTDYSYDVNGNMVTDDNKRITGITYNHLNLPSHIVVANTSLTDKPNGGTIDYVYDAAGNKLQKIVTMIPPGIIGTTVTTTTTYINGFVYERTEHGGGVPGGGGGGIESRSNLQTQQDVQQQIQGISDGKANNSEQNTLQFAPQEEGRIRFIPGSDDHTIAASFAYDYFIKDHLGNTRMVLTDEVKQDKYPVASLEEEKLATEQNYYAIDNHLLVTAKDVTGLPDYTNDNGIGNNPSDPIFEGANSSTVYVLNSTTSKTGLGITLRVMAGDRIDVFGKSYYFTDNPDPAPSSPNIWILDLLSDFLGAPNAATTTAIHGPVTASSIYTTGGTAGLTDMFSAQTSQNNLNTTAPRAFINVVFFDDQFKVCGYRVSMVGTNSTLKDHYADLQNIEAPKNGFAYIYCSNETPVDVFFDNLQVVHTRSPLLEESHYYPFGLTMAGISSKAAGGMENKRKFNKGSELQNKEFSDGSGLELYATDFRSLDPQLGRWWQIDTKPNVIESPYATMGNNPIRYNDPLGDTLNVGDLQKNDSKSATALLDDLASKSGLTLTQDADGNVSYEKSNGEAVIATDASGKQVGSKTARKELMKVINSKKHTVNIKYTDGATMIDNNGRKSSNNILLNPKEIQAAIDNVSKDLNPTTWGWALSVFHELGHTLYKGGDLSDAYGPDDPKSKERLPNKIRRELGVSQYGQVIVHDSMYGSDGKQYYPFSKDSYDRLLKKEVPLDKYILGGWQ